MEKNKCCICSKLSELKVIQCIKCGLVFHSECYNHGFVPCSQTCLQLIESEVTSGFKCDICLIKRRNKNPDKCLSCNTKDIKTVMKLYNPEAKFPQWGHVSCMNKLNERKEIEIVSSNSYRTKSNSISLWADDTKKYLEVSNYLRLDKAIPNDILSFLNANRKFTSSINKSECVFQNRYTTYQFLVSVFEIIMNKPGILCETSINLMALYDGLVCEPIHYIITYHRENSIRLDDFTTNFRRIYDNLPSDSIDFRKLNNRKFLSKSKMLEFDNIFLQ